MYLLFRKLERLYQTIKKEKLESLLLRPELNNARAISPQVCLPDKKAKNFLVLSVDRQKLIAPDGALIFRSDQTLSERNYVTDEINRTNPTPFISLY